MDSDKDHSYHSFQDRPQNLLQPFEISKSPEPQKSQLSIPEDKIVIAAAILLFSFLGVLIRIYSEKLLTYMGQPVAAVIYPQLIGCFIIGIAVELKAKIESFSKTLYMGLTTGLCGSITTFSGVILGSSQHYFNTFGYERTSAQSMIGGLTVDLLGFGIGYIGFLFGKHLGEWIRENYMTIKTGGSQNLVTWFNRETTKADLGLVILGALSTLIVIVVSLGSNLDHKLVYSLIFAPIGTYLRRFVGKLNSKNPNFPFGTFSVNASGSAFLAVLFLIPGVMAVSDNSCNMIVGLMTGFCGCFTTISTFILELSNLNKRNAYIYGGASIFFGEILSFIFFMAMKPDEIPYKNVCVM